MQQNKRKYHRLPSAGAACTVFIDGVRIAGEMRDESISGAKVSGLELLMLPLNKKVDIEFEGETFSAFARNAQRGEDGLFIVGFRRDETTKGDDLECTAMLLNAFFEHHGSYAICVPLGLDASGNVTVQLWNGKQFVVPLGSLKSLTRTERFEILANPEHLKFSAGIYGFQLPSSRSEIFDFEYGKMNGCPTRIPVS